MHNVPQANTHRELTLLHPGLLSKKNSFMIKEIRPQKIPRLDLTKNKYGFSFVFIQNILV